MKRILIALTFVGILATCLASFAQTTSPANDTTANDAAPPAAAPDAATLAAQPPAPAAGLIAADSAAPPTAAGSPPTPEAPAPAATAAPANDAAGTAPAATTPAAAPASDQPAADKTAGAAQPSAVIPLIVMDDVPLTDAIRNLARQADINYMLDPKIGYGQMGADGKVTPQPAVTIRWEKITAEQALTALLNNYTLQLVEDPKSNIRRVTTKDPAALPALITKIIQLKYANPSNVVASVQATFTDKRSKVLPDTRTSQLVVVATEMEMVDVEQLVESLDTKTRQVLIEARLLETVVNPATMKGINWSGTLKEQNVTFGNGITAGNSSQTENQNTLTTTPGTPTTTTLPGGRPVTTTSGSSSSSTANSGASSVVNSIFGGDLAGFAMNTAKGLNPATFFLNADGVRAVLSFLNTYAETKVISSPRTVTLDNEASTIEVGTLYPIVNTSAGTANTAGGSSISYSNLTVSLKVTPRISANNYIRLQVSPRVVRLGSKVTSVVGGVANSVDSFNTREITTIVLIPSGNTLVMGGLIEDNILLGNTKVPILGDLPYLGLLFRSDSKSRTKSNMTVFLTPTIVEDEDFQPTKSTFLKTPVPVKDSVEDGDWSAWDSGKPKDWSKKVAPDVTFDDGLGQSATPSGIPAPASN